MIPLFVLVLTSSLTLIILKIFRKELNFFLSARVGMSVMLVFTAVGHFLFPKGMSLMIPDFFPLKMTLVYVTAIIEILGAIGLLIESLKKVSGWLLILFLIIVLPANINAAMNNLNYQNGNNDGPGLEYLWFRVPLQILFIFWIYFSAIYTPQSKK